MEQVLRQARRRSDVLLLIALAAACWAVTASRMRGMDMGPFTDLGGLGWFAGVWATMTTAMMLPSLTPVVARRGRSEQKTLLFAAGYLLPWIAAGLGAYAVIEGVRSLAPSWLAWGQAGRYAAGAVILAAALYELTPFKRICLRECRNRGLLAERDCAGLSGVLRAGIGHGAYCLGCCWALMAALFALGVMSLRWMVVVALVIAVEKLLAREDVAVQVTSALLLALALGVALFPGQVPGLTLPA
jgi:predicted metal-binding membrane protein